MGEKINYNKTVELHKLVLEDKKFPKISTRVGLFVLISAGGIYTYQLIKSQLQVDVFDTSDYFIMFFAPIIYLLLSILGIKTILNRTKLKEIQITLHHDEAKQKILKAASSLNWSLFMTSNNYFRFHTKFSFLTKSQTITIIFFPDNKVYFNSLDYPDDDLRPARFEQNYTSLIEELKK
jgi:hypothetical protein